MKTKAIPTIFLTTFAVFLVLPMSTMAAQPTDVTITMAQTQGVDANTGTWLAFGAFTDEGTVVETYQAHWLPSGNLAYVLARALLTAGDGSTLSIQTRLDGYITTYPPGTWGIVEFEGTWEIISGTGRYEGAVGHGRALVVVDLKRASQGKVSNFVTLEGVAKL